MMGVQLNEQRKSGENVCTKCLLKCHFVPFKYLIHKSELNNKKKTKAIIENAMKNRRAVLRQKRATASAGIGNRWLCGLQVPPSVPVASAQKRGGRGVGASPVTPGRTTTSHLPSSRIIQLRCGDTTRSPKRVHRGDCGLDQRPVGDTTRLPKRQTGPPR